MDNNTITLPSNVPLGSNFTKTATYGNYTLTIVAQKIGFYLSITNTATGDWNGATTDIVDALNINVYGVWAGYIPYYPINSNTGAYFDGTNFYTTEIGTFWFYFPAGLAKQK